MKRKKEFPRASWYLDRHGSRRWRFRAKGITAELGKEYGSDDFIRRYEAAERGEKLKSGVASTRTTNGTFNALVVNWYRSPAFLNLAGSTQTNYRNTLEKLREQHGHKRIAHIERRHILDMMAAKSETPNAANFTLRMMHQLLAYAVEIDLRPDNPALGIKRYSIKSDGFHTWSEDEIERFFATHPAGSVANTAMSLMLYTGAARSDAVRMGWHSVRDGRISYKRLKTGVTVDIPVHPDLALVLDMLPRTAFTFLQTSSGRSRSANGIGNYMRKWCDEAGLPECSSHGLRKACATRLADAGATPHQIAAVTGHKTLSEVERYTRAAGRADLADTAMDLIPSRSKGEQKLTNHPARFVNINDRALKNKS